MSNEGSIQGNSDWLKTYNIALEDVVNCDTAGCGKKALFYAKVTCCGGVLFVCSECLVGASHTIEIMIRQGQKIQCASCLEFNNPYGWMGTPKRLT